MAYAEHTEVSVEKTRAELETILRKYGADAFGYMTEGNRAAIKFRAQKRYVQFILPLPDPKDAKFTTYMQNGRIPKPLGAAESFKRWDQACRSSWRALLLAVKAKLEAVERGISVFDQEFLANIVMPDGSLVGDQAIPLVQDAYRTGRQPEFRLALLPENPSA